MKNQTLHQCNLDEIKHIDSYLPLVSNADVIVFYAKTVQKKHIKSLSEQFSQNKVYFLLINEPKLSNISFDEWVNLVDNANRTLTWK